MKFEALTDDERGQIIAGHLKQAEADQLNNTLNARKAAAAARAEKDADKKADWQRRADEYVEAAKRSKQDAAVIKSVADDPSKLDDA